MNSFKVICIDDTNRPNDIPISKWVVKNNIYTVIKVVFPHLQPGTMGFKLAELNIDECFPYQYFSSHRFAMLPESEVWAEETLTRILEEASQEEKAQVEKH